MLAFFAVTGSGGTVVPIDRELPAAVTAAVRYSYILLLMWILRKNCADWDYGVFLDPIGKPH